MNDWEENKCKFYSRLPGNKLIYQSYAPITMSISEDDKKAELDCFIDNIRWRYGLFELKDFVENNRKSCAVERVCHYKCSITEIR